MSATNTPTPTKATIPSWVSRMRTPCTLREIIAMVYAVWKANPDAFSNTDGDFKEFGGKPDAISRKRLLDIIDGLLAERYRLCELLTTHNIDPDAYIGD